MPPQLDNVTHLRSLVGKRMRGLFSSVGTVASSSFIYNPRIVTIHKTFEFHHSPRLTNTNTLLQEVRALHEPTQTRTPYTTGATTTY